MKVNKVTASVNTVTIDLEAENPAEIALCNLLHSCEGTTETLNPRPPEANVAGLTATELSDNFAGVRIVATVKKGNRY